MDYRQIERDFVLRSLALLEQYDSCELKQMKQSQEEVSGVIEKYEVTLLINCLLGLIVLPKERYSSLPNILVRDMQTWGIEDTDMKWGIKRHGDVKLHQVIRRMRNSIAHFNIAVLAEDTARREIYAIVLEDVDPYNPKDTFYMEVKVENLRTFVTKLAEALTSK